ncbi:hypothetical protein P40081_34635 [Paenibacillus sp. FSL P4-0081]|nr:hypothetical protein P40081_34635 [Paenibacillus sp. FSL P4-0081]
MQQMFDDFIQQLDQTGIADWTIANYKATASLVARDISKMREELLLKLFSAKGILVESVKAAAHSSLAFLLCSFGTGDEISLSLLIGKKLLFFAVAVLAGWLYPGLCDGVQSRADCVLAVCAGLFCQHRSQCQL